jgi:hypothetical protein
VWLHSLAHGRIGLDLRQSLAGLVQHLPRNGIGVLAEQPVQRRARYLPKRCAWMRFMACAGGTLRHNRE